VETKKKKTMWTPQEVRKLISQCAGILFGIGGILLMIADVKATGKINISTNLVSGQIESGSAGLLLLFFAFFLVLLPAFQVRQTSIPQQKKTNKGSSVKKSFSPVLKDIIIALTSGVLTIVFFLGGHQLGLKGISGFSNTLIIGGYCFASFTGLAILGAFFDFAEVGQEKNEDNSSKQ